MDFKDIPITNLIPQRSPSTVVDRLLSCDMTDAVTEFVVREDNIFLDQMTLAPTGIIENIAQSCAARMGCINMQQKESVKLGFIGDIRNCEIIRRPKCHETMTTYVNIIEDIFNLTLASVTVKVDDEVISTARIKIALTDMAATDMVQPNH